MESIKGLKLYVQSMNGDQPHLEWHAYCKCCGTYIHESYPHHEEDGKVLCGECAFIQGKISEAEYIHDYCYAFPVTRAAVHEGKVYTVDNEKFPWEKTNRDYRKSVEYQRWRKAVFDRDDYTCAICGQRGGDLNAHHIKPFKDFKEDRFNVDNGITLCITCHRRVHKEKDSGWIYTGEQINIRQ